VNGLTRLAPLLCMLAPALLVDQAPSKTRVTPARFADVTSRATIAFTHKSGASPDKRMVETFGSGVAWIDYDNDGFPDLYFVNGAPGTSNALYHNNHDGTFTDVTAKMGVAKVLYAMGVNFGDLDNDGWLDFYIGTGDPDLSTIVPEIGLGRALGIRAVEIFWPATARTQTITGLQMDRFYIVREDANTALAWKPKKFPLAQSPELRR
jgi:FG-GAP-like repeat